MIRRSRSGIRLRRRAFQQLPHLQRGLAPAQRHGADEISADKAQDDYELEVPDDFNLEEEVVKEELLAALRHELATLQDIDRTILMMIADGASEAATGKAVGLSQKAVNKRKHKLYALLKEHLKDFR